MSRITLAQMDTKEKDKMKIISGKVWGLGMAVEPFETTSGKALACKIYLGPLLMAFTIHLPNTSHRIPLTAESDS
jgi:hypothetical protein